MLQKVKVNLLFDPEKWVLRKTAEHIVKHLPDINFNMIDFRQKIQEPADITHATHWAMWFRQPWDILKKGKNIITVHHLENLDSRILSNLSRLDKIIVISKEWYDYLLKCGVPVSKLTINRRGVDLNLFYPRDLKHQMLTIGYVGRKYPGGRKGEKLLVEIAEKLKGESIQFIFIGQRWEEEVKHLKENLGFRVQYLQNLSEEEVARQISSLDLMLITSKVEGGPFCLIEALASGIPVLTTSVGLAKELIINPDIGKIYETAEEAAKYIKNFNRTAMMSLDKINKRRKMVEDISWDAFTKRLRKIYEEVLRI